MDLSWIKNSTLREELEAGLRAEAGEELSRRDLDRLAARQESKALFALADEAHLMTLGDEELDREIRARAVNPFAGSVESALREAERRAAAGTRPDDQMPCQVRRRRAGVRSGRSRRRR